MPLQPETDTIAVLDGAPARLLLPILIFNVHSHCNCRCMMCDIWKRTTSEEIRPDELQPHRESLRALGVREVVFSGGEPLLHSALRPLCSFFRELNIRLTLLSTGLLLAKRSVEVAEYFDEVIVSIDGPGELHDRIRRVPGAFALIHKGVAAIRALRPGLRVTCRTTVQKANHNQLCATARAAWEAGFDSISFLAADLTSEAFNRPLIWPGDRQNQIALTETEIAVLAKEIEALLLLKAERGAGCIAEGKDKLKRMVDHFRAHLGFCEPEAPVCNAPWVSAVIETDGSVRPCFFHGVIGNIGSSTLEQIVNGEAARHFRETLDMKNNATCQRCVCSLNRKSGADHPLVQ